MSRQSKVNDEAATASPAVTVVTLRAVPHHRNTSEVISYLRRTGELKYDGSVDMMCGVTPTQALDDRVAVLVDGRNGNFMTLYDIQEKRTFKPRVVAVDRHVIAPQQQQQQQRQPSLGNRKKGSNGVSITPVGDSESSLITPVTSVPLLKAGDAASVGSKEQFSGMFSDSNIFDFHSTTLSAVHYGKQDRGKDYRSSTEKRSDEELADMQQRSTESDNMEVDEKSAEDQFFGDDGEYYGGEGEYEGDEEETPVSSSLDIHSEGRKGAPLMSPVPMRGSGGPRYSAPRFGGGGGFRGPIAPRPVSYRRPRPAYYAPRLGFGGYPRRRLAYTPFINPLWMANSFLWSLWYPLGRSAYYQAHLNTLPSLPLISSNDPDMISEELRALRMRYGAWRSQGYEIVPDFPAGNFGAGRYIWVDTLANRVY